MNGFTTALAEMAHERCKSRKRKKSEPITIKDLIRQMERHWVTYRDGTIAMWAGQLEERGFVPDDSALPYWIEEINAKLCRIGVYWEIPLWEPDNDQERDLLCREQVQFVTWGLACPWWQTWEWAGLVHNGDFESVRAEITEWLREKQLYEASVVIKTGKSGTVYEQPLLIGGQDGRIQLSVPEKSIH